MELEKREFSDEKRQELADKGHAMKDGSFPIENISDLHNAIQSIGRSKNYEKTKAHIIQRAKDLEATSILPEDWKIKKFFDDVKNMIKAIGTTSSANQEADERSVENYVRQSSNTNTKNTTIGGNPIVSNTTEPDPKGDIAVTKSFPTPNAGDLVDQTTRPEGDVSVSDAPNNPGIVPNQETIPSGATSAIAPSKTDEVNTPDTVVVKASAGKCETCGQALPVEKADEPKDADELTKASTCSDCGKSMDLCDCMGKAVDEKEEEPKPMKKSIWGGAFAPVK